MQPPGSVTRWIEQLRSADPKARNEAARQIWLRYFPDLLNLARANLHARIRTRADEDDVLQSMYNSVCLRIERGLFALEGRNDLWRLLVTMTLNKARGLATKHTRERRDVRRQSGNAAGDADDAAPALVLEQMEAEQPDPETAALLNERFENRLKCLSPDLRQVALWRLEGYSNKEIADKIGRVERTVERKLDLIREKWEQASWD